MEFKRETYVQKLSARRGNGLVKIITGARRAGKSYILNELFFRRLVQNGVLQKNIIKFAFDSDEDIDLLEEFFPNEDTKILQPDGSFKINAKKFRAFIKKHTNETEHFYLLLDEVQLLENFVTTLNSYLRHTNFDIYVTGSNSRFLSSDISTEFKGRGAVIHVLPLSFSEYVEGLDIAPSEAWKNYIETGGIPIVAKMQDKEEQYSYLKNLCPETYLKDIIERNSVRKKTEISELFEILASEIGTFVNPLKLSNTFESVAKKSIDNQTIDSFISYFEDAFLIKKVKKYNIKGKKYIGSPFKIYFEDIGVRNAELNFRQIEETHIMENVIYNELRFCGFNIDVGEADVSEKTDKKDVNNKAIYAKKALEVDFVATFASDKIYVQSALNLGDEAKLAQEKRPLLAVKDSFRKIIITKNGLNRTRDENGIETVDLFDFLLHKDSLK